MTYFEKVRTNLEHARQVSEDKRKAEAKAQLKAKLFVIGILLTFAVCLILFGDLG